MKKKTRFTYIGGQAVINGVMMRGKSGMATVVRDEKGAMQLEARRIKPPAQRKKWTRFPFIRGVVNFCLSLRDGMSALFRSSEVAVGEDEAPSKLSRWVAEKWKVSLTGLFTVIATVLGVALALILFFFLPQYLTDLIAEHSESVSRIGGGLPGLWYSLIEGLFRLVIFILYLVFTLAFPSLRETYRYHGAEHKTINCFEYGKPLTVENVKGCSRMHDRCGTTFLFMIVVISVIVIAFVHWLLAPYVVTGIAALDFIIRFFAKLLCLPIVASISYECLKLLALIQSPIVFPLKAPGYLLQKITTREPSDEMIECAIAAFEKVRDMDADPNSPEKMFATEMKLSKMMDQIKKKFARNNIDEADAEWIFSLVLGIPRSELQKERIISQRECRRIIEIFEERMTGRPLWYIVGDTSFYGYPIKVDERVLIPRPETEILVQQVVTVLNDGDEVLDLCTGSGAIAIAVANEAARDKNVNVTGVDISGDALDVARENVRLNKANVKLIKSDLFDNVRGRFNVIMANPPYVKSAEIASLQREVRDFEPHIALDGGADGLDFYRRIAEKYSRYVVRGGMLIMECGEDQAREIIKLFPNCDYSMIVKDFAGKDRIVKVIV